MGWFVEWTFATTYNIARESGQGASAAGRG